MAPAIQIQLRHYQHTALAQLAERTRAGARRIVLVAPTGAGKTTIAAQLVLDAVSAGQRVLFLAHRRELIGQAYERLAAFGLSRHQLGVVMAKDPRTNHGAVVQVASIDSLRRRAKPLADLIITDECHRALAKSYVDLAEHYKSSIQVGLTATPYRNDGRGLGDAYDDLLVVASPRQLIDEGYLVEPEVYTVPGKDLPDLSEVRTRRGDYDQGQLARAVDRVRLVGNIVEHWTRFARDLRTVVFAASVAHSRHITERFLDAGVAAEHLDGTTPTADRDAILRRIDAGETQVVCNVGVLCEGWDQPSVKCAVLARPTRSTGLYLQQAGRILRPWQDSRAVILDHAGCAHLHGLPQDDRSFSLYVRPREQATAVGCAPVKVCPECERVIPAATVTCKCGTRLRERMIDREGDGELVRVTEQLAFGGTKKQRLIWRALCREAEQRGNAPGWVYHRYCEMTGEAPPPGFQVPRPRRVAEAETELDALRRTLRQKARAGGHLDWDDFS